MPNLTAAEQKLWIVEFYAFIGIDTTYIHCWVIVPEHFPDEHSKVTDEWATFLSVYHVGHYWTTHFYTFYSSFTIC